MKVLLADENLARSSELTLRLRAAGAHDIVHLQPGERLLDAVKAAVPDIIIVDMARPDRDSLDGVREVASRQPRPIVMFVDEDDPSFMEDAIAAGVSSYNVTGASLPDIKPIVQAAVAIFRRHEKVAGELEAAQAQLSEKAVIDRAKGLLMRAHRMDEPQAYRWLRRNAMKQRRRIVEVARDLVEKGRAG